MLRRRSIDPRGWFFSCTSIDLFDTKSLFAPFANSSPVRATPWTNERMSDGQVQTIPPKDLSAGPTCACCSSRSSRMDAFSDWRSFVANPAASKACFGLCVCLDASGSIDGGGGVEDGGGCVRIDWQTNYPRNWSTNHVLGGSGREDERMSEGGSHSCSSSWNESCVAPRRLQNQFLISWWNNCN